MWLVIPAERSNKRRPILVNLDRVERIEMLTHREDVPVEKPWQIAIFATDYSGGSGDGDAMVYFVCFETPEQCGAAFDVLTTAIGTTLV